MLLLIWLYFFFNWINWKELVEEAKKHNIKIVFVGPEVPLVKGIKDYLEKKGFFVFGPSKAASRLEKSKSFTKQLCKKYKIPTAEYKSFSSMKGVKEYIKKMNTPIVIKADGLASGKGVSICNNKNEALQKCKEINQGKGTLGKLAKDDSLYVNLDRTAANIALLMADMKTNPKRYVHFSLFGTKEKK